MILKIYSKYHNKHSKQKKLKNYFLENFLRILENTQDSVCAFSRKLKTKNKLVVIKK